MPTVALVGYTNAGKTTMFNSLTGGDFMAREEHALQAATALDLTAHFITFVDHLIHALMEEHPDAIVERREALIEIPALVRRAKEAVDSARRSLAAQGARMENLTDANHRGS